MVTCHIQATTTLTELPSVILTGTLAEQTGTFPYKVLETPTAGLQLVISMVLHFA
jgi:hypothetical protein